MLPASYPGGYRISATVQLRDHASAQRVHVGEEGIAPGGAALLGGIGRELGALIKSPRVKASGPSFTPPAPASLRELPETEGAVPCPHVGTAVQPTRVQPNPLVQWLLLGRAPCGA